MEQSEMDKIVEPMAEHICDQICRFPREVAEQKELESICMNCQLGQHVCQILNQYNCVNDFDKSQCVALMQKYYKFVRCDECEYQAYEKSTDIYWCRMSNGLDGCLREGDGCTRGKKRE